MRARVTPWLKQHLRLVPQDVTGSRARRAPGGWRDWLRLVPEVTLSLGVLVLVDMFLLQGDRYASWLLHPFWIPVLMATAQYGLTGGAFAAIAATLALYAGALPEKGADQDYYEYVGALVLLPAAWFSTAVVLGAMRTLHMHKEAQVRRALGNAEERLEAVTDAMNRAVAEIERLERRIAADTGTVNRVLEGVARSDFGTAQALAQSLQYLVTDATGATVFRLYMRSPRGFDLAFTYDEEGDAPRMEPAAALFEALIASGQPLTREGGAASPLPFGAALAAPIVSPHGEHLTGAILIDRFRATPANMGTVAARAALLGRAVGALLDAISARNAARPAAPVERLLVAGEG
jgi:hypothetical protein